MNFNHLVRFSLVTKAGFPLANKLGYSCDNIRIEEAGSIGASGISEWSILHEF